MRLRKGITLIEVLLSATMFAIIATALSTAFGYVVLYQINAPKKWQSVDSQIRFEDQMREIIQAAYLSPTATDNATYFIGTINAQNPNGQPNLSQSTAGTTGATTQSGNSGSSSAQAAATQPGGSTTDGIVLTVAGRRIPQQYLYATGVQESAQTQNYAQSGQTSQLTQQAQTMPSGQSVVSDLQTLNTSYGPQGGIDEIAISMTPVGNPGAAPGGLYIREQRPADADYTQGGYERVLNPDIHSIGFEFYDGTQYLGSWDSTANGQRHLPAAVRITYTLNAEPDIQHVFVVALPLSDITPNNPLNGGGSTGVTPATGVRPATGASNRQLGPRPLGGILPLYSEMQLEPDPNWPPKSSETPASKLPEAQQGGPSQEPPPSSSSLTSLIPKSSDGLLGLAKPDSFGASLVPQRAKLPKPAAKTPPVNSVKEGPQ